MDLIINVSDEALEALKNLLEEHKEYNCVKLSCVKSCCAPKVEISLDEFTAENLVTDLGGIKFCYDKDLIDIIKEVHLIYKNSQFMLKAVPSKTNNCDSKGCNKTCGTGCDNCK